MDKAKPDTVAAIQRVMKVRDRAREVFGGVSDAKDWIEKTSATLGGSPKDLAIKSVEDMNAVLLHLAGIERHRQA